MLLPSATTMRLSRYAFALFRVLQLVAANIIFLHARFLLLSDTVSFICLLIFIDFNVISLITGSSSHFVAAFMMQPGRDMFYTFRVIVIPRLLIQSLRQTAWHVFIDISLIFIVTHKFYYCLHFTMSFSPFSSFAAIVFLATDYWWSFQLLASPLWYFRRRLRFFFIAYAAAIISFMILLSRYVTFHILRFSPLRHFLHCFIFILRCFSFHSYTLS